MFLTGSQINKKTGPALNRLINNRTWVKIKLFFKIRTALVLSRYWRRSHLPAVLNRVDGILSVEMKINVSSVWGVLLWKNKRQYLPTFKVSRYCCLVGRAVWVLLFSSGQLDCFAGQVNFPGLLPGNDINIKFLIREHNPLNVKVKPRWRVTTAQQTRRAHPMLF